jgi:hypothetical protein
MILSLKYGELGDSVSETNKLTSELGQYVDELSRKVQQKMYSVEGGMSSALNSADYYVSAKIKQLRNHESNARSLSTRTQTLLDTARRVDTSVRQMIEANQKNFFQKNPDLRPAAWKLSVLSFIYDLKNAHIPILSNMIRNYEESWGAMATLFRELRYWYKCDGGQQIVTNIKVEQAIAAVVFIVLFPSIAAGIMGIISIVNANLETTPANATIATNEINEAVAAAGVAASQSAVKADTSGDVYSGYSGDWVIPEYDEKYSRETYDDEGNIIPNDEGTPLLTWFPYRENCKEFARKVVLNAGGSLLPGTVGGYGYEFIEWDAIAPFPKTNAIFAKTGTEEFDELLENQAGELKEVFLKNQESLQRGDVIQIGNNVDKVHTAIIESISENGIYVTHSNSPYGEIHSNVLITWEEWAKYLMAKKLDGEVQTAGISVYRPTYEEKKDGVQ